MSTLGKSQTGRKTAKNVSIEEIDKDDFDIALVKDEAINEETGEVIEAEVVEKKPKQKAKQEAEPVRDERPEPEDPTGGLI